MAIPSSSKKDKLLKRLISKEAISLSVLIMLTTSIIIWYFASVFETPLG